MIIKGLNLIDLAFRYTAYKFNCLIEASSWMKIERKNLESEIKGSTKAITKFKDVLVKIRMFCNS